jgi:hypothetical protein
MSTALSHFNPHANLISAWIGVLLGFLSGLVLGMFFHREDWLGGYGSLRRRLYRLAHISFFGLGAVNLFFFLTAPHFPNAGSLAALASWLFIAGAVAMPTCCVLMAHVPHTRLLFAVPVISLIAGGALTLVLLLGAAGPPPFNSQLPNLNSP